jgi:hypothetical protein
MRKRGLSLLMMGATSLVLSTPAGRAAPELASTVLYCTPETSEFRIASAEDPVPAQKYESKQGFDASALITMNMKTEMRTGTRTKHLQCGDVSIDVRGGFYNANPQGELGAADDFAKLTIGRHTSQIDVALVDDACSDAPSPRAQTSWGEHPVQAIEGHRIGGSYQVTLFKTSCEANKPYTQVLTWP